MQVQRSRRSNNRYASLVAMAAAWLIPNIHFSTTLAQQRNPTPGEGAAACATCGACSGVMILIPIAILALNIALLVWVAKDAKSRGMDSSVLWMILVMLTSIVGLIIYMLSRPKGELVECSQCHNRRLSTSAKCPHCGNA